MTEVELKSEIKRTKDIPYLVYMVEQWGVYCDNFGENWLHYNGITVSGSQLLQHSNIERLLCC